MIMLIISDDNFDSDDNDVMSGDNDNSSSSGSMVKHIVIIGS